MSSSPFVTVEGAVPAKSAKKTRARVNSVSASETEDSSAVAAVVAHNHKAALGSGDVLDHSSSNEDNSLNNSSTTSSGKDLLQSLLSPSSQSPTSANKVSAGDPPDPEELIKALQVDKETLHLTGRID